MVLLAFAAFGALVEHVTTGRTGPAPETANQSMRRGLVGAMPDVDLVSQIAQFIEDSAFHGEGFHKKWARLSYKRISTS